MTCPQCDSEMSRKWNTSSAKAMAGAAVVWACGVCGCKLTQAEMRVLGALVDAGGITDVASVVGISEATVKTHLQHIFAKTNTKRQAELIKLLAGYRSSLR